MPINSFKPSRVVTVDVDGAAAPFDAIKAVIALFEKLESDYQSANANVSDYTSKAVVVRGKHPYAGYQFTITTNMTNGTFQGTYSATIP
jgi:hypothetical protein